MAENINTNISISSESIKSLAEAATAMNTAAASIASSLDGMQKTVEGLDATISGLADGMAEAQDSMEFDQKVREDAERRHAEATGANKDKPSSGYADGEDILSVLGEIRGMVDEIASARGNTSETEIELAGSILGDTINSSVGELKETFNTRMDAAMDLFAGIGEQLGAVKTWLDANSQVQRVSDYTDNNENAEGAPEEVTDAVQTVNPLLDEIVKEYSSISAILDDIGVSIKDISRRGVEEQISTDTVNGPVEVASEQLVEPHTERETDRGTEAISGIDDLIGAVETVGGTVSESLTASVEGVNTTIGAMSAAVERVGERVDSMASLMEPQSPDEVTVKEIEPVANPVRVETVDGRDYTENFNHIDDEFGATTESLGDSISRLGDTVKAGSDSLVKSLETWFNGKYGQVDGNTVSVSIETPENEPSVTGGMPERTDSETMEAPLQKPVTVMEPRAEQALSIADQLQVDARPVTGSEMDDMFSAGSRNDMGDVYATRTLADMLRNGGLLHAGGLIGVNRVGGNISTGLGPIASLVGSLPQSSPYEVEPSYDISDRRASSEPDRYGAEGNPMAEPIAERPMAKDDVSGRDTVKTVETRTVVERDGIDMNLMRDTVAAATRSGMLDALTDYRVRAMINESVADIVRGTINGITG